MDTSLAVSVKQLAELPRPFVATIILAMASESQDPSMVFPCWEWNNLVELPKADLPPTEIQKK